MSVKRTYPQQRLRRFFNRRDGTPAGRLLSEAGQRLEAIRDPTLAHIDRVVERIQQLGRVLGEAPDPAAAHKLYHLANEICGIAGAFGLIHLGKAAYSLCELLDRLDAANKWNWVAVQVHLDGLQLLRTNAGEDAERDQIIDGLVRIVSLNPPPGTSAQS
jgi:hypothetical protein